MKRKKLKKSVCMLFMGFTLGRCFGIIASHLCGLDTIMFILFLIAFAFSIAAIMVDDLDKRVRNAYIQGRWNARYSMYPFHPNCRHSVKSNIKEE